MAIFQYKGINAKGKPVEGLEDADNARVLQSALRRQGIFITEYKEKAGGASGDKATVQAVEKKTASRDVQLKGLFQRVKPTEVSEITRQMATLLRAGVPVVESLAAIGDQLENPKLKEVISQVRQDVKEGMSLSGACQKHPKIFTDLYANMVRAGESSGALEVVFERLAEFTEAQVRLRGKVSGALAYPVIMMVLGAGMMSLMMVFVIPKMTEMFTDMGAELPMMTKIMVGISEAMRDFWWLMILALFGLRHLFRRWTNTEQGRARWDGFKLRAPVFGKLVRLIAVSRFARTLGTLMGSGVPLLSALGIVKNVVNNAVLAKVIEGARDEIREGASISEPLERSGEFPPMMVHMIRIGEKTGEVEGMLNNTANAYDQQVEARISTLTSVLEPLMIVVMGVVVALLMFSILMPMMQMNELVQK
jgi:general secretion pathway protein F